MLSFEENPYVSWLSVKKPAEEGLEKLCPDERELIIKLDAHKASGVSLPLRDSV
jgi:hypothetical protein